MAYGSGVYGSGVYGEDAITITGEAFVVAPTFLDGSIVDLPVTVSGEAFSVAVTMLDGSTSAFVVNGEPFSVGPVFVDGQVVGADYVIFGEPFVVAATMLDGIVRLFYLTDPAVIFGRYRDGWGDVTYTPPVAPDPRDEIVLLQVVTESLPYPTLTAGRPHD